MKIIRRNFWDNLFRVVLLGRFLKGLAEIIFCFGLVYLERKQGVIQIWSYLEKFDFLKNQLDFIFAENYQNLNILIFFFYLLILGVLIHGATKIATVICLLKNQMWVYVAIMYLYSVLAAWTLYKYVGTTLSMYLWTALSYAIFGELTIYEYKKIKFIKKNPRTA